MTSKILIAGIAVFLALASPATARGEADCGTAITTAQHDNAGLPAGVLNAIGVVESGRRDLLTGQFGPWPWSVNAAGDSRAFATRSEAIDFVRDAQARGIRSIDVGCMQVNLLYHPNAFASLDDAFAPEANVQYAAAFLLELRQRTGDWLTATGNYHSASPGLARDYTRRVQAVLTGEPFPTAWPPNQSFTGPPAPGTRHVRVIEPGIDPATRNVLLRTAVLPRIYHPGG